MIAWLTRSRKAITAEIAILLSWAGTAYVPDGAVSRPEWYALAVAVAAGLGVYAVPNEPIQVQAVQLIPEGNPAGGMVDVPPVTVTAADITPAAPAVPVQPAAPPAP